MAKAVKRGTKKKSGKAEPLSDFQELEKRKRTDPNDKKKKAPAVKNKVVIVIDKIKIDHGDFLCISFSKIESDGSNSVHPGVTFEGRFMHADTRMKFTQLKVHLALLCDYLSTQQIKSIDKYNPELVEKFTVSAVSIKEDGVVVTGHKITKSGKAVILNSPFTRFESEEENAYRYAEELKQKVEELVKETLQYLDGSKVGEDPQEKLEFPNDKKDDSFSEEDL